MKLLRILALPWAVPVGVRIVAGFGYAGILLWIVAGVLRSMGLVHWTYTINVFVLNLGLVGMSLFSAGAVLMRGARQLRVPGLQRDIIVAVCLYTILSIGVPVCFLAFFGAAALHAALVLSIGLCGGMLFSLASREMAAPVALLWMVYSYTDLPAWVHPPAPWTLVPVALLTVVGFVAVVWAWRRIVVTDNPRLSGGVVASMLRYAKGPQIGARRPAAMLSRVQTWVARRLRLDTHAELRGTGPRAPVHSMRVALGGFALIRGRHGLFAKALPLILLVAGVLLGFLVIPLFSPQDHQDGSDWQFYLQFTGVFGIFGGVMLVAAQIQWLLSRWSRTDAELPLLALLPGLGSPTRQRAALLRAALGLPLATLALLLLSTSCIAIGAHLGMQAWVLLAVAQLGLASVLVAFDLCIFAGRLPRPARLASMFWAAVVLSTISIFALTIVQRTALVDGLLGVLWAALGASVWVIGWRGWKGFQRRPHAFLAN